MVLDRIVTYFCDQLLVGNEDAANHYGFVKNNPVEIFDLFGLQSIINYPPFPGFGPTGWEGDPTNLLPPPTPSSNCHCGQAVAKLAKDIDICLTDIFRGGDEDGLPVLEEASLAPSMVIEDPIDLPGSACADLPEDINEVIKDCSGH